MSVSAMAWAKQQKTGSASAKLVLLVLADYADERGCCWPSQATIAREAELTDRSIRTHLLALEELGLIRREERRRENNSRKADDIFLLMDGPAAARKAKPSSLEDLSGRPGKDFRRARKDVPGGPEGASGLTSLEPPFDPSIETAAAVAPEAASDWPVSDPVKTLVGMVLSPRLDPAKSPGLITTSGRLKAWQREGASWEFDVVPVVTTLSQRQGGPIASWKFFDAAIAQSIANNRAGLSLPPAEARTSPRRGVQGWSALEQSMAQLAHEQEDFH